MMNSNIAEMPSADEKELFQPDNYSLSSLEDEIQVDQRCQKLLKLFLGHLHKELGIDQLTAGAHARGADFFLRDYMIDHWHENIFSITPDHVKGFGGNWYIIKTLEPNMKELTSLLEGIASFYTFCAYKKLLRPEISDSIVSACSKLSFYQQRIDSFHELEDGEYLDWDKACPIR